MKLERIELDDIEGWPQFLEAVFKDKKVVEIDSRTMGYVAFLVRNWLDDFIERGYLDSYSAINVYAGNHNNIIIEGHAFIKLL